MAYRSRTRREMAQRVHYDMPAHLPSGQDRYVVDVANQLFAVADGVGGSFNGAAAAQAACETFQERAPSHRLGIWAVLEAMPELYTALDAAVVKTRSQTTFTGAIVTDDGYMAWLHAGDSRLLHLVGGEDLYSVTSQQHDPLRTHLLWNYLGGNYSQLRLPLNVESQREPMWGREILSPGDRLIFATDGIGPVGFGDVRHDTEWWMHCAARSLGRTAAWAADCVLERSVIPDDGTLIVVDIDA